jgi:hypothetical protein
MTGNPETIPLCLQSRFPASVAAANKLADRMGGAIEWPGLIWQFKSQLLRRQA